MSLKWEPKKAPPPIRYLVFASTEDDSFGGWNDLYGGFSELALAKDSLRGTVERYAWAHLVDLETEKIIMDWRNGEWVERV